MRVLRHADLSVTMKIYAKASSRATTPWWMVVRDSLEGSPGDRPYIGQDTPTGFPSYTTLPDSTLTCSAPRVDAGALRSVLMGWLSQIFGAIRARLGQSRMEAPAPGQLTSIDAVIAQMAVIGQGLPPTDGVAEFNRMYLQVTELVRDQVGNGFFAHPSFVTRLDLVFAGIYLDAVAATTPSPAWAPLFECRSGPGRQPIQYALAGMNAHINHDLPIAVVRTCRQLGLTPDSPGVGADYRKVNDLLGSVEQQVRQSFLTGIALEVDKGYAAPVANLVASWSITAARDAAWTNANVLWELHGVEPLQTDFLATLSGSVGLASRCLLTPLADLV